MRRLTAALWAMVLLGQTDGTQREKMTVDDVTAGAKTFRSHCAECHGLNGEGGRGPNLSNGVFYHGSSDLDLLRNISNGIPGTEMPGLFYSSDRVWQVIAYIRSLNQHSTAEPSGDSGKGQTLFASSGCANCHRIQGQGGLTGPDLTNIGKMRSAQHLREAITNPGADVRQRYWVVDLVTDGGKSIGGFLMNEDTYSVQFINSAGQLQSYSKSGLKSYKVEKISKMPSYQDRLTKKEVDDVVAYLSSLRPKTGGEK
jgi:cytochrome c oxidase cbb3-type subunit III